MRGNVVSVGGERIHYTDAGSGPAIVLVHGLSGVLQNFTYALTPLLAERFRVIAVDRPGSGGSTRRRLDDARLPRQGALIAAFIESLDLDRPTLVGHSLGGAVALSLALDYPSLAKKLKLIAPLTMPTPHTPRAFAGLDIASPVARAMLSYTIALPIALMNAPRTVSAIFAPEAAPHDFGTRGGGRLALRPSSFYHASTDLRAARDDMAAIAARYRELSIPVSVLFGTKDAILDYRVHGQEFAQIAGAKLELIEGGGHMLPVTRPAEVAAFLA